MEESVIWCLSQVEPTFFLWALVVAVAAYFLGCFNGAVIVSKYILRDDVRGHGSGNAGLTNFYRTFGGALTFVVILTDVLKAVIAILLGRYLFSFAGFWELELLGKYWAALFCLLGHMFPCMFHFKGGKGILSGGTIAIMMDWRIAMVVWGGFLILAIVTKYVSLGSVWAGQLPLHLLVLLSRSGDRSAGLCGRRAGGVAAPGKYPSPFTWNGEQVQLPS